MFYETSNENNFSKITHNITLKPHDRFLKSCPIRYDCRRLFVCLLELDYCKEIDDVAILLQYPEVLERSKFNDKSEVDFIKDVKKFAFPYRSILKENQRQQNSSLVQFYTFVFTDAQRNRLYGFCRSAQYGNRVLCLVSHLPWYNVFINMLNKLATTINEKDTSVLYNLLEALYEYELPEPGDIARVISHDGLEQFQFTCPDRRDVPSINENRNLLKFFAFFDLNKLIKIFTALLVEKRILIVSKDLENITACALSLEYLIYPLEWSQPFASILPDNIDLMYIIDQPFPYIYGVHTSIYQKLQKQDAAKLRELVILLVDERDVLNADNDQLPKHVSHDIRKKLKFFHDPQISDISRNMGKYDLLLKTGPIRAFQEAVLSIIGDYRQYLVYDDDKCHEFKVDDSKFYQLLNDSSMSNENDFYHLFQNTQAFSEFIGDRCDYLKEEKLANSKYFQKDFIDHLFEQYLSDSSSFQNLIKSGRKKFDLLRKQTSLIVDNITEKAKEKQVVKKLFNTSILNSNNSNNSDVTANDESKRSFTLIDKQDKTSMEKTLNSEAKKSSSNLSETTIDSVGIITKYKEIAELKRNSVSLNENLNNLIITSNSASTVVPVAGNSTRSLSISSSSSSSTSLSEQFINTNLITNNDTNRFSRIDINLTNDPDINKYLINVENDNKQQEKQDLADIFNRTTSITSTTATIKAFNDSTAAIIQNNNDNPFANDRFIDQFLINNDNNDNVNCGSSTIFTNNNDLKITIKPIKTPQSSSNNNNNNNNNNNSYQSIINEFDPILTTSSSSSSSTSSSSSFNNANSLLNTNTSLLHNRPASKSELVQQQINSLYFPKPFQQQSTFSNAYIQSPMSSYQQTIQQSPQQQQQQQQQQQPQTPQYHFNSYSSFTATPFYGFNQRSQVTYHPVAYPLPKLNTNMAATATTLNTAPTSSPSSHTTQSSPASKLLFDNDNSLI